MARFERCPECSASVKATNVPDHLQRVHGIGDPESPLERAWEALEQEGPEGALELLGPGLDTEDSAEARSLAGICLSELDRDREALPHFRRCVELEPREAAHWYNLGLCNLRLHLNSPESTATWGEVRRSLQRVLELEPSGTTAREARKTLRALDTAVRRELRRKDPSMDAGTWFEAEEAFRRAFEEMRKGDLASAAEGFQRVLERDPCSHKAHGNLGLALLLQGKLDEAEAHLRRALELEPGYAPAFNNLAMTRQLRGKGPEPHRLEELRRTMLVDLF